MTIGFLVVLFLISLLNNAFAESSATSSVKLADVLSTFIAALALIVSIWTIVWTRKNDIRSVKPHVEIYKHFWGETAEIQISNIGLGPAVIQKVEYFVNDESIKGLNEALSKAGLDESFEAVLRTRIYGPGYMIANNKNQNLIWIDSEKLPDKQVLSAKIAQLITSLKKIRIKIVYKSMHEEVQECNWIFDRNV